MASGGPLLLGGNLIPYINRVNRKLCAYSSECQKDTIKPGSYFLSKD